MVFIYLLGYGLASQGWTLSRYHLKSFVLDSNLHQTVSFDCVITTKGRSLGQTMYRYILNFTCYVLQWNSWQLGHLVWHHLKHPSYWTMWSAVVVKTLCSAVPMGLWISITASTIKMSTSDVILYCAEYTLCIINHISVQYL